MCLAGRQLPSKYCVREQGITGWGRNHCAPKPCACKLAKDLRISGFAKFAIIACCALVSSFHPQSSWNTKLPTVYVQLELQLWQYCNITLNLVGMPSWVVISCRLHVSLQEEPPSIQHQARRLSHQAPLCRQSRILPVWMRRTTLTGQALLGMTTDHRRWFRTCWAWCGRTLLR